MWGYLGEFWDLISESVVEAGVYTIGWFESVGNAVAGAIGGMFEWLIHYTNDGFLFLGWISAVIKELITAFLLPLSYFISFLKTFILQVFANPIPPDITFSLNYQIMAVFNAIPYWSTLTTILGVAISVVFAISILKLATKL